jgi:hypothetical protein
MNPQRITTETQRKRRMHRAKSKNKALYKRIEENQDIGHGMPCRYDI